MVTRTSLILYLCMFCMFFGDIDTSHFKVIQPRGLLMLVYEQLDIVV